jgi:hypothetical protein
LGDVVPDDDRDPADTDERDLDEDPAEHAPPGPRPTFRDLFAPAPDRDGDPTRDDPPTAAGDVFTRPGRR